MSTKVSSVEVADLMLRNKRYMTVAQVTKLIEQEYPQMLVSQSKISNILRSFVRSPFAHCKVHPNAYPRQYRLLDVTGYIFKVRDRKEVRYDDFCVESATKANLEKKEQETIENCMIGRQLMDRCMRGRAEKTPLQ